MPTEWRGLGEGQGWRRHTAGARSAHGAQLTTGSANLAPCMRVDKRMAQAHGERRVLNKTTTFSEVNRRLLCARLWVPSINPILYYCEPGASGRGSVSVHSPQPLWPARCCAAICLRLAGKAREPRGIPPSEMPARCAEAPRAHVAAQPGWHHSRRGPAAGFHSLELGFPLRGGEGAFLALRNSVARAWFPDGQGRDRKRKCSAPLLGPPGGGGALWST